MNLTVTAKGRSMTFKWRKHGGEYSDDIKILEDGDKYHVTELLVIIIETLLDFMISII